MKHESRRSRAPTERQLRVGELIRHALFKILERGELRDPNLAGISVTISEVRMSPDLRSARVYVMPLGGSNAVEIAQALDHAASFLRKCLSREVELKYLPKLSFEADTTFDQASRINELLSDHLGDVTPSKDRLARDN